MVNSKVNLSESVFLNSTPAKFNSACQTKFSISHMLFPKRDFYMKILHSNCIALN